MASPPPFDPDDVATFIKANLPLASVTHVPGVRLHQASPTSGLARLGDASPYWAYPWAGGVGLARYILDHPEALAGRRVLDLGAGSGLVGLAAARAGAKMVIAAEIDPYARVALSLNAAANEAEIGVIDADLTGGPAPPGVDVILVGDLFYEAALAARVAAFLERCAGAGQTVLVGDPWRAFIPRPRLTLLAEYPVSDFGQAKEAAVFAYKKPA
jgi:predicted nicotinamide N-methyase